MIDLATVAALAAVVAATFAVGVRDARAAALAIAVAMIAAPLAVSPFPGPLPLAARLAGALLGADLLFVAARVKGVRGDGSLIGLPADAALAIAAFLIGLWILPVSHMPGPATGQAAGIALILLAVVPLASRDTMRAGMGAALLCLGLAVLREVWLGPATALEDLAVAVLLAGILGATSLLIAPLSESRTAAEPEAASGVEASYLWVGATPEPAAPAAEPITPEVPVARRRASRPKGARPASTPSPTPISHRYAGAHLDFRRTRRPRDTEDRG